MPREIFIVIHQKITFGCAAIAGGGRQNIEMVHCFKEAISHPKIFHERNLGSFLFLTNSWPLETKENTFSC